MKTPSVSTKNRSQVPRPRILIVEDETATRSLLKTVLSRAGFEIEEAEDGVAAVNAINHKIFEAILLDLDLPRVSGMEVLAHIKMQSVSSPVIVVTGNPDIRVAVKAMKEGAYDYLTKPFVNDELTITVQRALEYRSLQNSAAILARSQSRQDDVIGETVAWKSLLNVAQRFSATEGLIYLEGETGAGKGVLARYIHRNSSRKNKQFVVVDCGSIPDNLIESELFGHQKGAFTGANLSKEGLVELADGGTLFLDEIGHVDKTFQQRLLTFVETKTFRRLGDPRVRTVDVRIIVASNRSIADEVAAGRFRNDLWFRLNVLRLVVPPLRERSSDIPVLAKFFLTKYLANRTGKTFSPQAMSLIKAYTWPGNVRELSFAVQRAAAISTSDTIMPGDLSAELRGVVQSPGEPAPDPDLMPLREMERRYISRVVGAVGGNITRASEILGIGRNTLHAKLKVRKGGPKSRGTK